ncbi:regulatory protein RecX [Boudabousia marimammalium]|uniref:Regulatory protein RecX n=1 Tax=Boudabousia marimammalium TaxID=156892 RepID=A0A1Q5PPD9_9ACTO|nr:regulatory protein RecX [Boudabousia marimammalium]OKL49265.1 hypothetical protein BM477_04565 [Boudabousia marimammalium]
MPVSERGQRLRERNNSLPHDEALEGAREYALRLLDQRAYPCAQIEQKLRVRGYQPEVCAEVVERLSNVGLLDDAAYAQMLVRTQYAMKGLSLRCLRMELSKRGISGEIAETALAQIDQEMEAEAARNLALKKAKTTVGLDYQKRLRRIISLLSRKGYPPGLAMDCARSAITRCDETNGDEPISALGLDR